MNSRGLNKNLLYDILYELNANITSDRDAVFAKCVEKKLTIVEDNKKKQLDNLYKYILSRSALKTLRAINRIRKEEEK